MTATQIIQAALKKIGVLADGQSVSASNLADGLTALKLLLRYWSAKKLFIPYDTKDTLTLTGAQSYTIGSGGAFNTARPKFISNAVVNDTGIDRPVDIVDAATYRNLSSKGTSSGACLLYYDPQYPLGIIYIYPISTGTLYLYSRKPLTEPASLTSSLEFDPAFDPALIFNLAVWLAPDYEREPSNVVAAMAQATFDTIEAYNLHDQLPIIHSELAVGLTFDINEG